LNNKFDLKGNVYGYLTVLYETNKRCHTSIVWHCLCKCGNEIDVAGGNLKNGGVKSCGCYKSELSKEKVLNMNEFCRKNIFVYGTSLNGVKINKPPLKNNKTGHIGVSQRKNGKYKAYINFQKKAFHLGYYDDIEDAIKAREIAEEKLFGNFLSWYNEQKSNNSIVK